MWRFTFGIGAEHLRSVTEIAPPQPLLFVKRSPVRKNRFHMTSRRPYREKSLRHVAMVAKFLDDKGLVKKYRGGWAGAEKSVSWGFEPCARGGSCNFQLPLGGGSPYFLLSTNETVDYTCYIKHSQLELLLKYPQTCCARKYKGWQAAHLYGRGTLCEPFFFFFARKWLVVL